MVCSTVTADCTLRIGHKPLGKARVNLYMTSTTASYVVANIGALFNIKPPVVWLLAGMKRASLNILV